MSVFFLVGVCCNAFVVIMVIICKELNRMEFGLALQVVTADVFI